MRLSLAASARRVLLQRESTSPDEQEALEKSFFKGLCLSNGTHKTTSPCRLVDVDARLCRLLPPRGTVHLLDVGISSGVTTLELLDRLEGLGHRVTGVGVDIRIDAYLRCWLGIDMLYDRDGHVLQVAVPFFAKGRPDHPPSSTRAKLLHGVLTVAERLLVRRWLGLPGSSRPVMLVSPRLLDRAGFRVIEHDVSNPMPGWADSFDLIRAANVLNLSYFGPRPLVRMVEHLTTWLKDGSLLVICRTDGTDGSNHGTIFRKQGTPPVLHPVQRIGRGSELEPLLQEKAIACSAPMTPYWDR